MNQQARDTEDMVVGYRDATTVTLMEAREALKAAVETRPKGFVYSYVLGGKCSYWPVTDKNISAAPAQRSTGCLIGVALGILNVHIPQEGTISAVGITMGLPEDVVLYFSEAQRAQDRGSPWGEAYELAEDSLKETA